MSFPSAHGNFETAACVGASHGTYKPTGGDNAKSDFVQPEQNLYVIDRRRRQAKEEHVNDMGVRTRTAHIETEKPSQRNVSVQALAGGAEAIPAHLTAAQTWRHDKTMGETFHRVAMPARMVRRGGSNAIIQRCLPRLAGGFAVAGLFQFTFGPALARPPLIRAVADRGFERSDPALAPALSNWCGCHPPLLHQN